VVSQPTWGEQIAEFVAQPAVSGLLLTIGFLGILIEMQTMHLIAGIIGVAALGLFFGAHVVAGTSNWVITALFGLGVLGLLFEFHVLPGHGISGLVGSALILASIVFAFGSGVWILGLWTTAVALVVSIVRSSSSFCDGCPRARSVEDLRSRRRKRRRKATSPRTR
jgi:membrane-bound ClpP family serine protease